MAPYEAKCQFCGEDVGPPEDNRPSFAFSDVTFYPGGVNQGVRIVKKVEVYQNPDDKSDISVHQECWTAYWDGTMAGREFYKQDTS